MSKSFYDMVSLLGGVLSLHLVMTKKEVSGEGVMTFDNPTDVPIVLKPTVVKSFLSNGLGILMHVSGDLYVIAYCLSSNGVVSVYLINGKGMDREYLSNVVQASSNLRDAIDTLRKAIVASFYWSGVSWTGLKLP